jgi:hypothetical protein
LNLTYDNPEIPIIRHLRTVVWRLEVLLFTRKKALSKKHLGGDMCRVPPTVSVCQPLWYLVIYSISFFNYEDNIKHKRGLCVHRTGCKETISYTLRTCETCCIPCKQPLKICLLEDHNLKHILLKNASDMLQSNTWIMNT